MLKLSEVALAVGITAALVACSKSEAPAPAPVPAAPMATAASGGPTPASGPVCTAKHPVNITAAAFPASAASGATGTITLVPGDVAVKMGTDAEVRWKIMPPVAASGVQFVGANPVVLVAKPPASSPPPAGAASAAASATEVDWCFPSIPDGWWAYTVYLQDGSGQKWACDPTIISNVGMQGPAAAASGPTGGPATVTCTLQP